MDFGSISYYKAIWGWGVGLYHISSSGESSGEIETLDNEGEK